MRSWLSKFIEARYGFLGLRRPYLYIEYSDRKNTARIWSGPASYIICQYRLPKEAAGCPKQPADCPEQAARSRTP